MSVKGDMKGGEVRFFDCSSREGELPEEMERAMWQIHRAVATGGGWEDVLAGLNDEASRCLDMTRVDGSAALIWQGPTEFFHHVVWSRGAEGVDGEEKECGERGALASLLARNRELQRALRERGQVVLRSFDDDGVDLLIPISTDEFLGAYYVVGRRGPTFSPECSERLVQCFGPLGVQLVRRHRTAQQLRSCQEENRYFRERERRHYLYKDLVCESEVMRRVYDELHERAEDDDPLWMTGEGGTGKELLARALHHLGARHEGMLIRMGCADFPPELVDIELFGCVANELTGAVAARKGIFELAEGGTVFLDEVDCLSPAVQGKLVRVLKEKEVRRIGDAVGRPVNTRFIASTHRDLTKLCDSGRFRRDLFELLRPHKLDVPPLRRRREDILPLAKIFLQKFADRYDADCRSMDEEFSQWLTAYRWPGNVRQLQTFMEAAVLKAQDREIIERRELALNQMADRAEASEGK